MVGQLVVLVVEGTFVVVVDDDGVVVVVVVDAAVDGVVVEDGESVVDVWALELVVVVVVGATPVSAEEHPEGGVEIPDWPGIKTMPAQPKFEK